MIADDDDSGAANLTYSLQSSELSSAFDIEASTGHIRRNTQELDFESLSKYDLTVQVQDSTGLTSSSAITVWVIDVNEAPTMKANSTLSVFEDAATGAVVGAIQASDPDGDAISVAITGGNSLGMFSVQNGILLVAKAALDYESISVHVLQITITELRFTQPLATVATLTVKVLNVNEPPVALAQTREIRENSKESQTIGLPLVALDPDVGQKLAFSITSGNDDSHFSLDADSGQLRVGKGLSDAFVGCFKSVQDAAIASSSNVSTSSTPMSACTKSCTSFQFMALYASATCLCSNVMPVLAQNQVSDTTCDLVCGGTTNTNCGGSQSFAVYRRSVGLDYERQSVYSLVVRVQDNGVPVQSASFAVSIAILDVNEAPSIRVSSIYVQENVNATVRVDTFAVTSDPDLDDLLNLSLVTCTPAVLCPFVFNDSSGNLSTRNTLDFEAQDSYLLTFRVTDKGKLTSEATLTVYVVDVNEYPVIVSSSFELKENTPNGSPIGTPVAAYDQDKGGGVVFSVKAQDMDGCVSIDPSTGQLSVKNSLCFDYEAFVYDTLALSGFQTAAVDCGSYHLAVQSVAFLGELKNYSVVQIQAAVVDGNNIALSIAGGLQSQVSLRVDASAQVFQSFAVSTSGNLASLQFQVPLLRQTRVVELSCTRNNWTSLFHVKALRKTFNVTVSVHDTSVEALSVEKTFGITLLDVNELPLLVAGQNLKISENSAVGTAIEPSLDSLFFDPEGATLIVALQSQSFPGTFYYDSITNNLRVGQNPPNFERNSSHTVMVMIRDAEITVSYNLTVSVLDVNDAPQPQCGQFQVSEAAPIKTVLSTALTVLDEDVGDTSFTFRVVNASSWFAFDNSGHLILENLLDYETQTRHYFMVEATDGGGLSGTCVAVLDVIDSNEMPVGSTVVNGSVHQSAEVGHQIAKIDLFDPEGVALSFAFADSQQAALFAVSTDQFLTVRDAARLQLTFASTLIVVIVASDGLYNVPITCYVQIVQDVPPIACRSPSNVFQILENSASASVGIVKVVNMNSVDVHFELVSSTLASLPFQMDKTGEIHVSRDVQLDFESQATYQLHFAANYSALGNIHCPLRIDVIDQNESPVCESQEVVVSENLVGNNIWLLQVLAKDPEASTLTFSMDATSVFNVNASGSLFVKDLSVLNFEAVPVYDLRVQASDGVNAVRCQVTVHVADANDCPVFGLQTRSVLENSVAGTQVGSPLLVSDEDNHLGVPGRIAFHLDSNVFTIEASSGQITVLNSSSLDFESQSHFELLVMATDDAATPCTIAMTLVVSVLDVNEPPWIVAGLSGDVSEFTAASTASNLSVPLVTVLAHDPDQGDTLRFAMVESNVSRLFRIDSRRGDVFAVDSTVFDFEITSSYSLSVSVTDSGGMRDTQTVEIHVLDVNEAPVFVIASASVAENSDVGTVVLDGSLPVAVDPEGQKVTYSVLSSLVPFAFTGNQLRVSASGAIDFETRASFQVSIKACDAFALCSVSTIFVSVQDVNEAPIVLPSTVSVTENAAAGVLVDTPVTAIDPDVGQQLTFEISGGDGSDLFGILSCNGQLYVKIGFALDHERTKEYNLVLTVSDNGSPRLSTSANVTILVLDENEPPALNLDYAFAVSTRAVTYDSITGLHGQDFVDKIQAASQPTGFCTNQLSYLGAIRNAELCQNGFSGPYGVIVTWQFLLWNASTISVRTLSQANLSIVFTMDNIVARTIGSVRPGSELQYAEEIALSSSLRRGIHEITAFVFSPTDDGITFQFRVGSASWEDVSADYFNSIASQNLVRAISEASPSGASVGKPIQVVDQDGLQPSGSFVFAIVAQDVAGLFQINRSSGQITLSATRALDFETQQTYNVLVEVRDDGTPVSLSAQTWVQIDVIDANEAPIIQSPVYRSVAENSAASIVVGDPLAATDPDGVYTSFAFEIVSIQTTHLFEITSAGQIVVAANAQLDYEVTNSCNLTVRVTDDNGLSTESLVWISVLDVNEPPTFAFELLALPENSPRGTVFGRLTGFDPENDTISFSYVSNFANDSDSSAFRVVAMSRSCAQIEIRNALVDFELQARFEITINASDSATNSASTLQTFTVTVSDVNEPPVLLGNDVISLSIPENAPAGSLVGTSLNSFLWDQDAGDTLSFAVLSSVPSPGFFTVDNFTGQLSVLNSSMLDFEKFQSVELRVQVKDSASNSVLVDVIIQIENVNEPPYFDQDSVQLYIPESTTVGSTIRKMSAIDPDGNTSTVQYQIVSSSEKGRFFMSASGNLQLAQAVVGGKSYNVTVRAVDEAGTGLTSTTNQIVQLFVSRVNSPPAVGSFLFKVPENSAAGVVVGQVFGVDSNPSSVLAFSVVPDIGRLSFRAISRDASNVYLWSPQLDYEAESQLTFFLCATDDGASNDFVARMTGCGTLTLSIVDVNEAPKLQAATCGARTLAEPTPFPEGELAYFLLGNQACDRS